MAKSPSFLGAGIQAKPGAAGAELISAADVTKYFMGKASPAVVEGDDAAMGVVTLVAGTKVVANERVTANSRIFLMTQAPGGTPGWLQVSARTAGTSFTILSSNAADTSVVAYLLLEPDA